MAVELTTAIVRDTTTPGFLWDKVTRGLLLKISPTGSKTWILQTKLPGKSSQSKLTIGKYPAMAVSSARKRAREWKSIVAQGSDPRFMQVVTKKPEYVNSLWRMRRCHCCNIDVGEHEYAFHTEISDQATLNNGDVVELLGVCKNTLFHWRHKGIGPPTVNKAFGTRSNFRRHYAYPVADLRKWLITTNFPTDSICHWLRIRLMEHEVRSVERAITQVHLKLESKSNENDRRPA